jgi:hypothetical protein
MTEFCVVVAWPLLRAYEHRSWFITGPFLSRDMAKDWIDENAEGHFKGRRFEIRQLGPPEEVVA